MLTPVIAQTFAVSAGANASDHSRVTAGPVDTTASNMIGVSVASGPAASTLTLTDSQNNVWRPLETYKTSVGLQLANYFCINPITSTTHTFSAVAANNAPVYPAVGATGFSLSNASFQPNAGTDVGTAAPANSTKVQTGMITPPSTGPQLILTACTGGGGVTFGVDSGVTLATSVAGVSSQNYGLGMGFLVQAQGASINPTWTALTGAFGVASIVSFSTPNPGAYLPLVTSEYQLSPRLLAWLQANLQLYQDIVACANNLDAAFSVNSAQGTQLDALGVILGQSRTVGFQPSGGVSPVLDDVTYRTLLRAKILAYHWNGTLTGLRTFWQALFGAGVFLITDNQDMTVSFYVGAGFTSIVQDLVLKGYIIPRPQAVLYNISIATLPMFGFDRNDSFVAGFDVGHFS
jgi:hypothetical protein